METENVCDDNNNKKNVLIASGVAVSNVFYFKNEPTFCVHNDSLQWLARIKLSRLRATC